MNKICLVVLYKKLNHLSIELVEKLYKNNFDKILHIVPLYDGTRENVINVFENKYQINGYIAQAREKLIAENCTHYIFMIEDCLLHPSVNSYNLYDYFNLDESSCFISDDIFAVNEKTLHETTWAFPSIYNFTYAKNSAQIKEFIPLKADARKVYQKFGVTAPYMYTDYLQYLQENLILGHKQMHEFNFILEYGNKNIKTLTSAFVSKTEQDKLVTIYPMVASTAGIFMIPGCILPDFAHFCGMFAAVRVHYNIGFAMSLVNSASRIVMKKDLHSGCKVVNLDRNDNQGTLISLLNKYDSNVQKLMEQTDGLVVHPVDLSKWNGA